MTSIQERLAAADGHYQAGKNLSTDGLPDNSYKFQLQDLVIEESQSSGRLQLHAELYVLEGEHAGEVDHEYMGLETDWGCRFAMEFIEKLGREAPEALDAGMEEVVSEIAEANPVIIAQIKTNKAGYKNIQNRSIKLISGKAELDAGATPGEASAEAAAPAEADAGDEPVEVGDNVVCSLDEGEDDGNVYEVASIDDDKADITDEAGEKYTVDLDTLVAVEVEGGEPEAEPDDPARAELVNLAQSLNIAVTDADSADDIVAKLQKFEFDRSELLKEEIELCEKYSIPLSEPAPAKPKATKKKKAKAKTKTPAKGKAKTKKKTKKKK